MHESTLRVHQSQTCDRYVKRTSAMAVELLIMHTARITLAKSPPGTTVEAGN